MIRLSEQIFGFVLFYARYGENKDNKSKNCVRISQSSICGVDSNPSISTAEDQKNYRGIVGCPGRIAQSLILAFRSLRVVIVIRFIVFRILQLANIQVLEEILKHR